MRDESIKDQFQQKRMEKKEITLQPFKGGSSCPCAWGKAGGSQPCAGTSCPLQSLISALPTDRACAAPGKQMAVTISELKKGEKPCGSVVEERGEETKTIKTYAHN